MLQTIREKLTGAFAVVILGAIALTLVVTFGNIDTGFTPTATAVTVNGEDVPVSEFRAFYQQQRQQWEQQFRAQIPEELARSMANSVIDSIARNRVIAQHVREQGYRVSDADVIQAIQDNRVFHVGGSFSQPAYEQLLRSEGFTPQRFEYEQRQNMELQQFVEGVAYSAFFTPAEFRRYIALDGETRDVEYVILPADQWAAQAVVDAEDIAARYEEDKDLYLTEENVALEYVEIDFAGLLQDTDVSDADVRQYYEENPGEFAGPDERQVSHILIAFGDDEAAAAAEAQQVSAELAGGAPFDSLAAKYSDDTGSAALGGSLGWLGSGDAPAQEFEDAMFALAEVGDVTEPVRTEFGFHLIRLDGVRAGEALALADVAADLKLRLQEDEAADRFADLLDELDERALESLDGLAPVAAAMGLELQQIDRFTRNGGGELGFNANLVDTVFSLEVLEDGENSPVVTLDDGRAVVVRVTEHRPSVTRPLAEVSDEIRAQLVQEEAIAIGALHVADKAQQLNDGADPATVLADTGLQMSALQGLRRGDAEVSPELSAAVFRAPASASRYATQLLSSGGYAIFRVTGVTPGQPDNFSLEDRDTRKEQLAMRLGGGQATGIVETLINEADVYIAPNLLENELGTN